MNPMRIAVWGLGRHALRNIIPALAATPGLALHGVLSRNGEAVSRCAEAHGCRGWTDPSAMLADPAVDVVYVATPIALHAEHGRSVLDAGKHLWCEKPLATTLNDAVELTDVSRRRGLMVGEGHMYLYHPHFRRLRSYIDDGDLGTVLSVTCRFGIPTLEEPGFRSTAALGGGALFDVGCYPVSAVEALFDVAPADVLWARIAYRDGSDVDTEGEAALRLPHGATARLEWRIHAAYRNEIDIWGDRGSVGTDRIFSKPADFVPSFRLRDLRGAESVALGQPADHFSLMLREFRNATEHVAAATAETERRRIVRRAALMERVHQLGAAHESQRAEI